MLRYFSSRICGESNSDWCKRRYSEIQKLRGSFPDMQHEDVGDGHVYFVERDGIRENVGYFSSVGTAYERKMPTGKPKAA